MRTMTWLVDLKSALRMLRRDPAFAAIAVGTLALGIGAVSTVFSLVNAIVLRGLPFDRADQIVFVRGVRQAQTPQAYPLGLMDIDALAATQGAFEAISPVTGQRPFNMSAGEQTEHVVGEMIGASYFDVLRRPVQLGRGFTMAEAAPATAEPVVILSDALWRSRFGARPGVLDESISLNDRTYRIVGVASPGLAGLSDQAQLWLPIGMAGPIYGPHYTGMREFRWLSAVARLRGDVGLERARQIGSSVGLQLQKAFPKENDRIGFVILPLEDVLIGDLKSPLVALSGAAAFVLLIACVNVANLLLARGRARVGELALRRALGADGRHVTRLLIIEAGLFGAGGALGGLLLAYALPRVAIAIAPAGMFSFVDIQLAPIVVAFALTATLVATLLASLAPALFLLRQSPARLLGQTSRGSTSPGRHALQRGLVVTEVALALALLIGAAAMARGFSRFLSSDLGLDTADVLTMRLDLTAERFKANDRYWNLARDVLARAQAAPNVAAAALEGPGFPTSGSYSISFRRPGSTPNDPDVGGLRHHVTPGYFTALRIPIRAGRDFNADDVFGRERALIVSQAFADANWPGRNPLGERLVAGTAADAPVLVVVGVVGNVRHSGRTNAQSWAPDVYISLLQSPARTPATLTLFARMADGQFEGAGELVSAVRQAAPSAPPYDVLTLDDRLATQTASGRFAVLAMTLLAIIALLLATSGVYGVVSYLVGLRTREVGLRLALGSERRAVLTLLLRTGLVPVAIGVVAGTITAWWAGRYLTSQLYGLPATDPWHVLTMVAALGVVAIGATLLPAWRATRISPASALRD